MANLFRKLVTAVSAAAVIATSVAIPAIANVGEVLESWDYTTPDAVADWTLSDASVLSQDVNDGHLNINNGTTNHEGTATKKISANTDGKNLVFDYVLTSKSYGDKNNKIYIGTGTTDAMVVIEFAKYGTSLTINGVTSAMEADPDSSLRSTKKLHITNIVNTVADQIETTVEYADDSGEIYHGTSSYAIDGATENGISVLAEVPRYNAMYIDSFSVSEYVMSEQEVLDAALSNFILDESQFGLEKVDEYYTTNRDVVLPTLPEDIGLTWAVKQKPISESGDNWTDTDIAAVEDGKLVMKNVTDESSNYYVKAEAIITYGSLTEIRSYIFVLYPFISTETVEYYNEDFDEFTGTMADLSQEYSNNTTYEAGHGITFKSSYRETGNAGVRLTAESREEYGNCLNYNMYQNVNEERTPKILLSRTSNIPITNKLVIRIDVLFPTSTAKLMLCDSTIMAFNTDEAVGKVILTVPSEDLVGKWLTYEISLDPDGNGDQIISQGADILDISEHNYGLKDLSTITVAAENVDGLKLDNLYVADYYGYEITDDQIASLVMNKLVIDTTQQTIIEEQGGYRVTGDFILPEYSLRGSTAEWSLSQKSKDTGEVEPTEYAKINENTVSIYPDTNVADYDIILTLKVSVGETTEVREYNLTLVTPQEVIRDALDELDIAYADGEIEKDGDVYNVVKDIAVQKSNSDGVVISWSASDERIDGDGIIYPTDNVSTVVLTATASFGGVSDTKSFTIQLPNAVEAYIDPAVTAVTAVNADNTEDVYEDLNAIGTVSSDIQFTNIIDKINGAEFDGTVRIEWTSDSEYLEIENGLVKYTVTDFDEHEVTVKATAVYVKNGRDCVSKEIGTYTYKVQFPESAVSSTDSQYSKYKVRFDAAYENNFEGIPSIATSDITLVKNGRFGSIIIWNSSNPSAISNSGKVSRSSSDKKVTLTASITADGTVDMITKTFEITVPGTGGGGGGGGSTSSTGTSSGGGGGGAIASSNGSNTSLTKPTTGQEKVEELIEQREEAENRFSDLGGVSWARDAINGLYDAGIVNGKTDTLFAPNDNVTRAEFAKMLMGVFGLTSDAFTTSSFYDVPSDSWYFQSVESAYNLGIINGVAAGYFDPNANITRQDMAVMVMRAATVSGRTISATTEAKSFNDADSIADYAKEAVTTLQTGGIINGVSDTEFAPLSNATRAQAAQILYSFL